MPMCPHMDRYNLVFCHYHVQNPFSSGSDDTLIEAENPEMFSLFFTSLVYRTKLCNVPMLIEIVEWGHPTLR